ncbi:MAG: hypothetical protein H8E67_09035 [Proteobacteria bacterium]|nr:hypothetical protein [Pseudomonadota bacterium]MBT4185013.1 hypothetical protein [Deltaproteobacteria bacterium]
MLSSRNFESTYQEVDGACFSGSNLLREEEAECYPQQQQLGNPIGVKHTLRTKQEP